MALTSAGSSIHAFMNPSAAAVIWTSSLTAVGFPKGWGVDLPSFGAGSEDPQAVRAAVISTVVARRAALAASVRSGMVFFPLPGAGQERAALVLDHFEDINRRRPRA
ncbi:hypothetical protein [Streptomyces virginiae]|uniref:hypothetical protein n=1 Tax=Streptomyces virginiae TaxID=1961 RepID=UPI0032472E02